MPATGTDEKRPGKMSRLSGNIDVAVKVNEKVEVEVVNEKGVKRVEVKKKEKSNIVDEGGGSKVHCGSAFKN